MMEPSRQRNEQALLHVVGISGSLRPGSYTRMALDIALRGAQHAGASIELIDLREYELPFCAGKMGELERSEDVVRLRQALQQAPYHYPERLCRPMSWYDAGIGRAVGRAQRS